MCEICKDLAEKDMYKSIDSIVLEIRNPTKNSQKKYEKSVEIIEKALGYSSASGASEISPYKSVRMLTTDVKKVVEKRLLELHNEIIMKWLGLSKSASKFKLAGKVFINPKTGKPLTAVQWKSLKREIMQAFAYVYGTSEDKIVKTAMALGRILADTPVPTAISVGLGLIKPGAVRQLEEDPAYHAALQFAQESASENIVELSQRQYKKIHDTIVQAQVNRLGPRQLESQLFDNFGEMNRDWRRIAETEIGNQTNTGQLIAELHKDRPEGDFVYMEGISGGLACPWCVSEVNDRIVVLLDGPPPGGGDKLNIDDKDFVVIWPGKSNVGRGRANWWVAAGTQHPHCQCSWIRYTPGYETERKMLDDAIAAASAQAKKEIIPQFMG